MLVDPYVHLALAGATVLALIGSAAGSPAFLSGLLLAVAAAVVAARDLHEGTIADTLTRVPDRGRLLLSRLAAPALLTAGSAVLVAVVVLVLGGRATSVAVEGPAMVLLTAQGVCLGLIGRRPAIAVPALVALWFVVPTALRALGVYLGGESGLSFALGWLSPVGLAAEAADWTLVPPDPGDEPSTASRLRGALGLVVWTGALVAAAGTYLRRRDF